jgi:polyisoprenoid-binding protein YceI
MIKYAALITTVVILALAAPGKPVATSGNWQVDAHHSDVQLATDGTTNFGKSNTTFTIGFARATGIVKVDASTPANSEFHIDFYPSAAMDPTIDHDGNVSIGWFANEANNTMICFHSHGAEQTADGRLKTTGDLGLMRVDRNVQLTANEAYSGPVYGAPIFHHDKRPATFIFDSPAMASKGSNKGNLETSASYKMAREDFPQFFRTVLATEWPALVRDKHCETAAAGEAYAGAECTGSFLLPSFPLGPAASGGEDYPGPQHFNAIVGEHMTIALHLRLKPAGSGAKASGGN